MTKIFLTNIFLLLAFAGSLMAQTSYKPSESNLQNREKLKDAKLGMFVHYGVYTQLDDPDEAWAMRKYTVPAYEKIAEGFDPDHFNAKELVANAKRLGFKYITITTKHHDGFCLFDSKYTNWSVMHYGKQRRDLIKEVADECHKQGIKLHFYYSLLDWHHPDFTFRKDEGGTYKNQTVKANRDEQEYFKYMENQLTELLSNYGTVDGIWFDGYWSKDTKRYPFDKIYDLIHKLQPACMVVNNHDMFYINGEDFMVYALYAKFPQKDYDSDPYLKQLPLQAMDMASDKWGYYSKQINKPADTLIRNLVKVAANNAIFLLNTGPLADGSMDKNFIDTMKVVKTWLAKNGETINGTRGGPFALDTWGGSTQKGKKIYVHLFNPKNTDFQLPALNQRVKRIQYFHGKQTVNYENKNGSLLLRLDKAKIDSLDTIIEIELE